VTLKAIFELRAARARISSRDQGMVCSFIDRALAHGPLLMCLTMISVDDPLDEDAWV